MSVSAMSSLLMGEYSTGVTFVIFLRIITATTKKATIRTTGGILVDFSDFPVFLSALEVFKIAALVLFCVVGCFDDDKLFNLESESLLSPECLMVSFVCDFFFFVFVKRFFDST